MTANKTMERKRKFSSRKVGEKKEDEIQLYVFVFSYKENVKDESRGYEDAAIDVWVF